MKLHLLILLPWIAQETSPQEVPTPSNELKPRNFNPHSHLKEIEPTRQGPVLFPNDAAPPPRPPLIVTSRPLLESIARSELAENNTITSQSQDRVAFAPFLARVKDYRPYIPSPTFNYQIVPTRVPYADLVQKTRLTNLGTDNRYDDYEEAKVLPPIYKALSDYAKQKVLNIKRPHPALATPPTHQSYYQNNDIQNNAEYDENQNYAFSYTVKDHKTGDDFSHSQHSSGSATNGEYRVRLPDGRMQIVSYTADENGYKADVRYDEDKTTGNTIEQNSDYQQKRYQQDDYQQNDYRPTTYQPKYYATPTQQSYISPQLKYVTPIQNSYVNEQNDYYNRNADYNNDRNNNYNNQNVEYTDRGSKFTDANKDNNENSEYQYPDTSKEYYNDYSSEYNANYEPHRSKFNFDSKTIDTTNNIVSTVKPPYEDLKHLFVTKTFNTGNNYDLAEIKVPSTTPLPYERTTEHVVHIGGKNPNLYTNIKHSLPLNLTPVPVNYATPNVIVATTPKSYLVSTIANLKNKISLVSKPVLSDNFISRINKYINFSNNN